MVLFPKELQAAKVLICPALIWMSLVLFFYAVFWAFQEGLQQLQRLHQIPCDRCSYFTGDYRLKCTVHPLTALSESASNCIDFEARVQRSPRFSRWSLKDLPWSPLLRRH